MRSRFFWLVGMRLFAAGSLVALIYACLMPGSGEREFQKTLDAMKNVHTFRALRTTNPGTQLNDFLWEVDCDQQIMHKVTHIVDTRVDPPIEQTQDEIRMGNRLFRKQIDGTWKQSMGAPPQYYCDRIAAGTDSGIMPKIATMLKKGNIQKGDKKDVNGVRCREWNVASRDGTANVEPSSVCIGLADHLPYELTVAWAHSRTTFSDYNTQISFDLPDAAVQPASATN